MIITLNQNGNEIEAGLPDDATIDEIIETIQNMKTLSK